MLRKLDLKENTEIFFRKGKYFFIEDIPDNLDPIVVEAGVELLIEDTLKNNLNSVEHGRKRRFEDVLKFPEFLKLIDKNRQKNEGFTLKKF